jgi:CheY-like chemotaxis protein
MPRVLVVDDSPQVRQAMGEALAALPVEIGNADNGATAVEMASSSTWDLIFLDVLMPVMDGTVALATIRSQGITTPVVLVTSVESARVVAAAVRLGGVTYIAKPFDVATIRRLAINLLGLGDGKLAQVRVLVQYLDPGLPARVASALPPYVALDSASSLGASIDLAQRADYGLILFETRDGLDEATVVANVLRQHAPVAGIFAVGAPASPVPWCPTEGLDGVISVDDDVARQFLRTIATRPLVFDMGPVLRTAGFDGPATCFDGYVELLVRALRQSYRHHDKTVDLEVDLRDLIAGVPALRVVVEMVNARLRDDGAAPVFRLGAPQAAACAGLAGIIVR